jgi:hypothetical protein
MFSNITKPTLRRPRSLTRVRDPNIVVPSNLQGFLGGRPPQKSEAQAPWSGTLHAWYGAWKSLVSGTMEAGEVRKRRFVLANSLVCGSVDAPSIEAGLRSACPFITLARLISTTRFERWSRTCWFILQI